MSIIGRARLLQRHADRIGAYLNSIGEYDVDVETDVSLDFEPPLPYVRLSLVDGGDPFVAVLYEGETPPVRSREQVPVGTPITTSQAARAVLREIKSAIVGNVDADETPSYTVDRIKLERSGTSIYRMLSKGERTLVDIAEALLNPHDAGARMSALGSLDPTLRRKIVLVLAYRYLGRDLRFDLTGTEFEAMFGAKS